MVSGMTKKMDQNNRFAEVPMQWVGPMKMRYKGALEEVEVPMATYENPLWPSTGRGAKVSTYTEGLQVSVLDDRMARSILLEAADGAAAAKFVQQLAGAQDVLAEQVKTTSRFCELIDIHTQQTGPLIFIRFAFRTGDAAGHNMVTKASDHLQQFILGRHPELNYVSISGNYCTDKKPSAVNGILGRGKNVVAEAIIPEKIVRRFLRTSAEEVVQLNVKKNLIGTLLAGTVRSANAHFANMLLAVYLATGQDAANIVEGSQGITYAENRDGDLYFSVTLPNLIMGAIGNGKDLPFVEENLKAMGCLDEREPGENSRRLAAITAAAVWCGELSLMAAQTNPGELMDSHLRMERS